MLSMLNLWDSPHSKCLRQALLVLFLVKYRIGFLAWQDGIPIHPRAGDIETNPISDSRVINLSTLRGRIENSNLVSLDLES